MGELSERTGVPVATLKFYLREGLLFPGEATSRTQADYGVEHVERVNLVRALSEVGGLSLAGVARVLQAIDRPIGRTDVMAVAQRALIEAQSPDVAAPRGVGRATSWVAHRGWVVDADDPAIHDLVRAWDACDAAGIGVDEHRLDAYADAVEAIARLDVDSVPEEPEAAVRQVVLGTVLVDRVLSALRRLAQQDAAVRRFGGGVDA